MGDNVYMKYITIVDLYSMHSCMRVQEYSFMPCWAFRTRRWFLVCRGMVMIIHVLPMILW